MHSNIHIKKYVRTYLRCRVDFHLGLESPLAHVVLANLKETKRIKFKLKFKFRKLGLSRADVGKRRSVLQIFGQIYYAAPKNFSVRCPFREKTFALVSHPAVIQRETPPRPALQMKGIAGLQNGGDTLSAFSLSPFLSVLPDKFCA